MGLKKKKKALFSAKQLDFQVMVIWEMFGDLTIYKAKALYAAYL